MLEPEAELVVRRPPSADASSDANVDQAVRLRSAALLWHEQRIPIVSKGIGLERGSGGSPWASPAVAGQPARIESTAQGHVLIACSQRGDVYLNGEPLVEGERRPLGQGDAIAVADNLFHYLPPGQTSGSLPKVAPEQAGRVKSSRKGLLIGRDETCDLTLDYPTVSRRHAIIRTGREGPTIEDCSSATGLRLNGVPVKRSPIRPGDEIAIGPYRIVFDGDELVERAVADGLPLEAKGVSVTIGDQTILKPTDVQLRAGELVALIGESGAGKTTLLRALAGVSVPSSGEVLCGGEPVRSRLTEIGYVPQFDIVHGQLTVFEALDFAAQLRLPADTSADERHRRISEVIHELGLTERSGLRVDELSGGQRKRVAVGVELLHRPGALFLDEPTTGLDPGLERMMMELFRSLSDAGQTVTLVTHATRSMDLCDRVIVMGRGGVKRFDGPPNELLSAFEVDTPDDVYSRLSAGHYPHSSPPIERTTESKVVDRGRAVPHVKQDFSHQTKVLATRYATLMRRDQRNLVSLAVQTLILGLMTAIIFAGDVFQYPPSDTNTLTGKAAQLLFLMVTISIWMGSISSAREIVKERSVVKREMAVGVTLEAYVASKLIVLLCLVSVQVLAFFLIVEILKPIGAGEISVLVVLIASGWIAVMLGLVVSAYSRTEDQAAGLIPILLIPQLLLGGALVTLNEMPTSVQWLATLIPSRWAYDAAGTATDMANRIGYQPPGGATNATSTALLEGYGPDFFQLDKGEFFLIASIFFAFLYLLLALMIRRNQAE